MGYLYTSDEKQAAKLVAEYRAAGMQAYYLVCGIGYQIRFWL